MAPVYPTARSEYRRDLSVAPAMPINFAAYTKDHWSFLLYIETLLVDHGHGQPDHRRMNEADRDAAEAMEADGLLVWGGTGINPNFSLTERGWAVAHAIRRARAEKVEREQWPELAARAAAVERERWLTRLRKDPE